VSPPLGPGQSPPSVAFLLSRLGFETSRELGNALADLGLELRQYGLLRLLASAQGGSQRALGAMLDITPNRMVALVDGLESKGLIERRPHPDDRRAYTIALTEAGAAAFGQAMQAAFGVEASMCQPLEPQERAQLLGLLQKLAAARNEQPGAVPGVHPGMLERDDQPSQGS
jgi:DNA-binding MarR family transcriptional regulator